LDAELRDAGVQVPPGASHADKVKLYAAGATPEEQPSSKKALKKQQKKKAGKTQAEKMLERRKNWVAKWSEEDDAKLVKRLRSLGIDGEGLSRNDLIDELLKAETERYEKRFDPSRIQFYALAATGCCIFWVFVAIVIALIV